jgi:hypothetical protein
VVPTSVTLGADVAPTIVGVQFLTNVPTGAGGTAISVQFSKSINTAGAGALPAPLATVAASVKVNGAAQAGATVASADLTTFTFPAPTGGTGGAGQINTPDVMTVIGGTTGTPAVPAGIADELEAPLNANASFNASANTVKPAMAAAITSISATTQGVWSQGITGGDTLTITAKPGSGADGANATLFAFAETAPAGATSAASASPATAGALTTFTLAWGGTTYANGAALAAGLNALAPFNTLFTANVSGAFAPGASTGAAPAYAAASGTFTYAVTVVWNKPVIPGGAQDKCTGLPPCANNYVFAGPAGAPAVVYAGIPTTLGLPVANAQVGLNVLIYTAVSAVTELAKGTTTVTLTAPGGPGTATAVTDFAGNTMTSPSTITLS